MHGLIVKNLNVSIRCIVQLNLGKRAHTKSWKELFGFVFGKKEKKKETQQYLYSFVIIFFPSPVKFLRSSESTCCLKMVFLPAPRQLKMRKTLKMIGILKVWQCFNGHSRYYPSKCLAIKRVDSNRFCCSRPLCCSFASVAPRPPPYKVFQTKTTSSANHLRKKIPLFQICC